MYTGSLWAEEETSARQRLKCAAAESIQVLGLGEGGLGVAKCPAISAKGKALIHSKEGLLLNTKQKLSLLYLIWRNHTAHLARSRHHPTPCDLPLLKSHTN